MSDLAAIDRKPVSRRAVLGLAGAAVIAAAGYGAFQQMARGPVVLGSVNDYVFVYGAGSPDVTLVDLAKNHVVAEITFPVTVDTFLVSKDLGRVYAVNRATRTLFAYDLASQAVEASLALPLDPRVALLSSDGLTLALADGESRLATVDLPELRVRGMAEGLSQPENLTFSNDSFHLFVTNGADGTIDVIDAMTATRLDPITLSFAANSEPSAITRTPNGLFGLIVDRVTGKLSIINFRNWEEMRVIDVGRGSTRPSGTADGRYMMIANGDAETLTVISTAHFNTEAVVDTMPGVTDISTGFFETLAFITSSSEKKSMILDLETLEIVGEISYGGTPGAALVDPDGRRMFVPIAETGELVVVDVYKKEILSRIKGVGANPTRVALAATNNYCH